MSKKITDLTLLATADATDILPLVDISASTTKKTTVAGLAVAIAASVPTGATTAKVATSETTASTTYADLTTAGPAVTVTIGVNGKALVTVYADLSNNTANNLSWMGFAVSGASTVAAADEFAMFMQAYAVDSRDRKGTTFLVTGLAAGSTTFTAKYKAANGTLRAIDRKITVVPL